MLLIGIKNTGTQTVLADGIINIGSVYRKYCKKNNCGVTTFGRTVNDVTLQQSGIYNVTATFTFTAETAGDVIIQLLENGDVVEGATLTETITTPTTEIRTATINYKILVDNDCVLGRNSTLAKTISFINASDAVDITVSNVVVNVTKEV